MSWHFATWKHWKLFKQWCQKQEKPMRKQAVHLPFFLYSQSPPDRMEIGTDFHYCPSLYYGIGLIVDMGVLFTFQVNWVPFFPKSKSNKLFFWQPDSNNFLNDTSSATCSLSCSTNKYLDCFIWHICNHVFMNKCPNKSWFLSRQGCLKPSRSKEPKWSL